MILNTLKNGRIISEEFSEKFDFETDLLVAGLGTAGAVCFYTAVKNGVKCIGIDKQNFLGGTGTVACVQDYYYGQLTGVLEQINKTADKLSEEVFTPAFSHPTEYSNSLSAKALALEKAENGESSIALGCVITGVILENKTVCGVRAFYKKRFINIKAKIVADNTNGFVCTLAGCKEIKGRKSDDKTMRASKTIAYLKNGKISGEWNSLGYIDGLDEYELSKKYLENETKPPILLDEYTDECRPVFEGTMIGKREVKRVRTKYVITYDDLVSFKEYEKPIFYGFASFDNVNEELEKETENLQNWILLCYMRHFGLTFAVPYECILPKNREGILAIGKTLGTSHDAACIIRMKAEMEKCGEAAAYAALIALSDECSLKDVDYDKLKEKLIASGCLKQEEYGIYSLRKSNGKREKTTLPKTVDEIKDELSSDRPQFALFSILRYDNNDIKENLYDWLESKNKMLKINSAIALGLIKDEKALPTLYEILSNEPDIHSVSNGPHYYGWLENDVWSDFIKAVILIGRFKDNDSLEQLKQLKNKKFNGTIKKLRVNEFIDEAIKQIES